jgi:hypothetical protein
MLRFAFQAVALALAAGALIAQEAGHATLPPRGAAARSDTATSERGEDPALVKIEELRKSLADTARAYKKTKDPARAEKRAELLQALLRVEAEAKAASSLFPSS